jgi:L-fuconolactonase
VWIDAHQHFWLIERGDYDWLSQNSGILYNNFLPHHIAPTLKECGIDKTVAIQAAPTVEETEYLLDLYDQFDFIAGVVGWVNFDSSDFHKDFERLQKRKGFVGLRPMLQDLDDDRWILKDQVKENIQRLVEVDFPIDILIYPRHIPYILELLDKFPSLRAVINHVAKPSIKDRELNPWKEEIKQLAFYENVMCKISGLITEADHTKWTVDDLRPYVHHVIQTFGENRVMFGSDWPVCLLAGSYKDVFEVFLSSMPKDTCSESLAMMLGENVARFYKIKF